MSCASRRYIENLNKNLYNFQTHGSHGETGKYLLVALFCLVYILSREFPEFPDLNIQFLISLGYSQTKKCWFITSKS